ncbi:2244_t:CDS:1 [Acaulospora morrowiae]|uniref:2244_t:CDS:1 n=1 Tax=Acaulospora morrowiae TaxID=94023 RepID=A0A9N8YRR8_9GLOM|nr:2244_t:CDS:1 [Acaulospora morrowiae]
MSPRTNSPPPSSYDDMDYTDYRPGTSFRSSAFGQASHNNHQFYSVSPAQPSSSISSTAATTTSVRNNLKREKNSPKGLASVLHFPLNIPRRLLSSTLVQVTSLTVIYLFCITTVCFIFCTSYVLTFYDDTRRVFRTSRVWAQVKNGVRDRISMLGDDWEEFFQKYFDGVDVNRNGHLGGKTK